ncbi:MAG: hypothetical protein U0Q03_24580 [Acidimicrobiales bacterium]
MNVTAPRPVASLVDRVRSTDDVVPTAEVGRRVELPALAALAVVGGVHLVGLSSEFAEVPYLGVGYIALIAAVAAAGVTIARHERRGWWLAGGASIAGIAAYALSRTAGLPGAHGDIGNWGEPLGVVSLVAEVVVAGLATRVLVAHRRARPARRARP